MKKFLLIWTIIIVAVVVVVVTTTASLAVWQVNDHNSTYVRTPVVDENPSLKYQMYVPVKASGDATSTTTSAYQRIPGSFSVSADNYSYTLTDVGERGNITGFSLAGCYSGTSLEYIEIPDEVTVKVNGVDVTKPVVRVKPETDYGDYGFGGVNTAITDIIIGSNVVEVTQGAFYGMAYLKTITINGESPIYLYPYCFGGCVNLVSIDSSRTTPTGWSTSMITAGSFAIQ